ncbi:MAG TPA: HAD family hydrolase [Bryobacteraceae bacterium]|nr:HAD family hydrolase [Bryobacteraceae bacterium]
MDSIIAFDMDGVLAEVTDSYREGVVRTVEHFTGQRIERDLVQQYKNAGGWNNDWALSQRICADLGRQVDYQTVVAYFNEIFIGHNGDGLIQRERWFPKPGFLERLQARFGLAIFTGRLRYELDFTLNRFAPDLAFDPIICAEHVANGKPAPDGLLAIQRMRPGRKLWYVGDTIDDARSARAARVPFIGVLARSHSHREELGKLFEQEKAAAIVENVNEIEDVL